ncbi:hypothetical protein [Pedobacter sp.]|uniref:carboxypeptidase-like regulatory domain-containing protein n=1 Tax=Pedobacter sp. TaxID=1411316 RepID=UPI003BAAA197
MLAQENLSQKVIAQLEKTRTTLPREKLYAHFNQKMYAVQDTMWFKCYLVDAGLNYYSKISALIYVDMVNSDGKIMQTISLPSTLGLTWAAIPLKENTYKPGKYTFRAYTNWMQNFGNVNIFQKEIEVISSSEGRKAAEKATNIKQKIGTNIDLNTTGKLLQYDIQFLAEGGTWIIDRQQKIGFKAINSSGKGIKISGEILDSKQKKVTEFHSNEKGMGTFTMTPHAEETYISLISGLNDSQKIILPKPALSGITLKIDNKFKSDSLKISILSDTPLPEITVLGQSRGVPCFATSVRAGTTKKLLSIAKNVFPTGVGQIILIDGNGKILNQRNLFLNHQDELKIDLTTNKSDFFKRDSIAIKLKVLDNNKQPIEGSFSMAVTDDTQVLKDSLNDENILTYLLMSSDLKGDIESPNYYFHKIDSIKHEALEALMLTQGWVSYTDLAITSPKFKAEKDYTINGKITNLFNKPASNAIVTLLGRSKNVIIKDTITNAQGNFTFKNFPVIDSTTFVIQVKNSKGKNGTLGIEIDEFTRPIFVPRVTPINNDIDVLQDSMAIQMVETKKQEFKLPANSGIGLKEVNIVGKKIIKGSKNLNGPGNASQTITPEDLYEIPKKTLYQVLREKVEGFRITLDHKTRIRDFAVFGDPVKLVIDGFNLDDLYVKDSDIVANAYNDRHVQFLQQYLDSYNAEDIEGIEIMTYGYTMAYASTFLPPLTTAAQRSFHTFIEITTKTNSGPFLKKSSNIYLLKPVAYGSKIDYYRPKYTTSSSDSKADFRSTIHWEPNILTNKNGEAEISFFSADKPGTYTVWIEGTDLLGGFGFKTMKLEVKDKK